MSGHLSAVVSPQLLRAARRRGRLNRAARRSLAPRAPRAAALLLTRRTVRKLEEFNRAIEELVFPELEKLTSSGVQSFDRKDAIPEFIQSKLDILRLRLRTIFRDSAIAEDLLDAATSVAIQNANQLRRTIGIAIRDSDFGLQAQIDQFVQANIARIRSLAGNQLTELSVILNRPRTLGTLQVGDLRDEIQEVLKVTKTKASLIARDQTLTLNSQITKTRQQNAGIVEYVWTTSGDERVRDEHAELDGTVQQWISPPISSEDGRTNHPGEDFQCRCTAFPVLPELGLERFE